MSGPGVSSARPPSKRAVILFKSEQNKENKTLIRGVETRASCFRHVPGHQDKNIRTCHVLPNMLEYEFRNGTTAWLSKLNA